MLLLGSYQFCPLLSPLCMKCSFGISNFLVEISSLSHSIVFLYFFSLITEEGFLISPCYSLEFCIGICRWYMGISFLFCLLLLFPQLFVRPPQTTIFAFFHFFFLGMALIPASYTIHEPPSIVLQALYQI